MNWRIKQVDKLVAYSTLSAVLMTWLLLVGLVVLGGEGSTVAVAMPAGLVGVLALLTLFMCMLGALISIRRITRIDPTSVFQ